jgi:alpha-amylase/alpha-mannosidase (GH57 family)
MEKCICIHGHFYQPPRENPWLEAIELQQSAYPYHDWNERITAECYATNAASRILDEEDRIIEIVNNYSKISFNFGPTLLRWMQFKAPRVYQAILNADQESQQRYSGHGSAIAQAYHHPILPLSNSQDKYTEILWAKRDFEHRFHRKPEGMWLPETAVDLETLDILAESDIRFTILSPHQAKRVRVIEQESWNDVVEGKLDLTQPYQLLLPSGRNISVFFYNDSIAKAVAFEDLLSRGEHLVDRLLGAFSDHEDTGQLVHIATDGETYGHHHRNGEMALSYALDYIEANELARLTNYGDYLEKHPPTHVVEILENTSWSCAHGVERWKADCGCSARGKPSWKQAWRAPLRETTDWLRDELASKYEETARHFLKDPWAARNDYIDVLLDRSVENFDRFLGKHGTRILDEQEKISTRKLLELQRHALLMYTSCGWFFGELSGIETVQVMSYAGRAIQLAQQLFGDDLESKFLERLARAPSNISKYGNGRNIYEKFVTPAMIDLRKVAAHYAISSLFEPYPEQTKIFCYAVNRAQYVTQQTGKTSLVVGQARITSDITRESERFAFGVLHFGDHNVKCGTQEYPGDEEYGVFFDEVTAAFSKADFAETLRLLDKHFGTSTYSLKSLFRDERKKVLDWILESTLSEVEVQYGHIYERQAPLMRFLADLGTPQPKSLEMAAELVLNANLTKAFQAEPLDLKAISRYLAEAREWNISFDTVSLSFSFTKAFERMMNQLRTNPVNLPLLQKLNEVANLMQTVPFEVNLRTVQNDFYEILKTEYPKVRKSTEEDSQEWVRQFETLGQTIFVRVAELQ